MAWDKNLFLMNINDAGAASTSAGAFTLDSDNDGAHTAIDLQSAQDRFFIAELRVASGMTGTTKTVQVTIQQSSDNSAWPANTDESTADNVGFSPIASDTNYGVLKFPVFASKRYVRANITLGNADVVATGVSLHLIPVLNRWD